MSKPDYNIKAEELRIGNWILGPKGMILKSCKTIEFWDLISYQITHLNEKDSFALCTPISLTPELLKKAGFEMMPNGFAATTLLKAGIRIAYHNWNASECSLFQQGIYFDFAAGQFKFVHQLQNLFFALTGEELQIDLK